jgi:D-arabinose 1-dehydrogenase-like Zn-dependent alcohol dehydrogenase
MGTLDELKRLVQFCVSDGIRPLIHDVLPLHDARKGFEALAGENVFGKIVFTATRRQPAATATGAEPGAARNVAVRV